MTFASQTPRLRFSANLGFLWPELPLTERIARAAAAGFDAVECHYPFDTPPAETRRALEAAGLTMVSLNTSPGDLEKGEFGLAALPGQENRARAAIDQAIRYAAQTGCGHVHVLAGLAANLPGAAETLRRNLDHASRLASQAGVTILLEAINRLDAPGCFWRDETHVAGFVREGGWENVRLMLDCYHTLRRGGDPFEVHGRHADLVAHVQFAGFPGRAEPNGDQGRDVIADLSRIAANGYLGFFGAEYRPSGDTDAGLGWLAACQASGVRHVGRPSMA